MNHPAIGMALALVLATPALAQQPAPVAVRDAWARATPPGAANGVIYLTLTSPTGDRLLAVQTPVAAIAGLHQETMDGGIMHMRALPDGLDLPAGQAVVLRPEGIHIMLEGLNATLVQGAAVPLHLTFAHAKPLDVSALVLAIGAAGPADAAAMPGMTMTH